MPAGFQEDRLIGGSGSGTFYGNIQRATLMGGGTGNQTFYNYNTSDTIQGNLTGVNTLVVQGDGSITLSQDATNVNAVDFTVNGQTHARRRHRQCLGHPDPRGPDRLRQ